MLVIAAYFLAILVFSWAVVAFAQAAAALLPWRPHWHPTEVPVTVTVLVPAHNEEKSISRTVRSIQNSGDAKQRVLVVADNCGDGTAELARMAGAEVIERDCPDQGGKPHALAHGLEHLRASPPDVVVIVDADCIVGGRGLSHLARIAARQRRPVQALNLIDRETTQDAHVLVSILGNRFHNLVRPLGNAKLGLPCLLMGTGMAIPWDQMQQVTIRQDSLGEDKQLGIDLALQGAAPTFFPLTKVTSGTPKRYEDYLGQRTRWEQGHLATAASAIPRLVWRGCTRMRLGLLTLAAELFVPPIAIIGMSWLAGLVLGLFCWWLGGVVVPIWLQMASAAMLAGCVLITWTRFARRLPLSSLWAAPVHVFLKLPIYLGLLARGPERTWLRTERDHE